MINYELIECIHKSENGSTVNKVRDESGKYYALKIIGSLSDKLNNLIFKREINALKKLNKYDDIVKIYDYDTGFKYRGEKNVGAILLEFVEGILLSECNLKQLSQLDKYKLCLNICNAISNAHNNGILHRDIKPENIFCIKDKIKIIDFGSSKIKAIIERDTTIPLFSYYYSAPEVVAGGNASEASDIYSLGVVLFEIFTSKKELTIKERYQEIEDSNMLQELKELL